LQKTKLFCIPYAGGSALVYLKWQKYLDDSIELCPVELPGRGRRITAPLQSDVNILVDDMYNSIKKDLQDSPFAIFGHSMGSLLGFELYYKIKALCNRNPVHVFFSGRYPPHLCKTETATYDLPREAFLENILKYGATPREVFDNKDLADIFIPILRSDYKFIDNYKYNKKPHKIECDMSILNGTKDETCNSQDTEEWKQHAGKECRFYEFPGGHFFIDDYMKDVIKIINYTLTV
jgi:surfactin synthase thioesterase subunit